MRPLEIATLISTVVCALALSFTFVHDTHYQNETAAHHSSSHPHPHALSASGDSSSGASSAPPPGDYAFYLDNSSSPAPLIAYAVLGNVPLLLAILHAVIEGPRWQLFTLYLANVLVSVSSVSGIRIPAFSPIIIILSVIAAALGLLFAVTKLPQPTGPYLVATCTFEWTKPRGERVPDENRVEADPKIAGHPSIDPYSTSFFVQAFYPMKINKEKIAPSPAFQGSSVEQGQPRKRRLSTPTQEVAKYLVHGTASAAAYANFVGIPKIAHFLMSHLSLVKMNATENGPLAPATSLYAPELGKEKFPVVLFSHGLGGSRTANAVICKELASFGFVVLCPEHTDGSASYAVLPSGLELKYQRPTAEMLRDAQWIWRFRHRQVRHRALQMLRVLDGLEELDEKGLKGAELFRSRIDTSQVCLMGHSFGAGTAVLTALLSERDSRIKAVVAYDAWIYPIGRECLLQRPLNHPILMIDTELFGDDRSLLHVLLDQATEGAVPKLWLKLMDTGHQNFTEFPFFFPQILPLLKFAGKMDPAKAMLIITNTTLRYLVHLFSGLPAEELVAKNPRARQLASMSMQTIVDARDAEHMNLVRK